MRKKGFFLHSGSDCHADASFAGHPDTVFGYNSWICLCAVHEEKLKSNATKGADWFCRRRYGSGFHMEPLNTRNGAVNGYGTVGVRACGSRILTRHTISADFRPNSVASAYEQR